MSDSDGPIVVAGATGQLGQRVVERLLGAGHRVRAIVRDPQRLGGLRDRVEVHAGDVLTDPQLSEAMTGARAVFSALGASVQPSLGAGRKTYDRVDVPANLRLLEAAKSGGVTRFVYVSLVLTPKAGQTAYVRAHERVVEALRHSGLDWCALRPTGFHSVFLSMLGLAASGRVPVFGDGRASSNPIADADLADLAVAQLLADTIQERELPLGGPESFTRLAIAELACEVAGRGKVISVPLSLGRLMALLLWPLSPRMTDLLRFALAVSDEDANAPLLGKTTLRASFEAAMAQRRGARTLPPATPSPPR